MDEKQRLMIKIAKLHYEGGQTQDEISRNLRLSRPRVSRLMQEAVKLGVVKISVLQEPGSYADIERQLEQKYHLLEVVVTDVSQPVTTQSIAHDVGVIAADYFNRIVIDGDIIGLTWGATLASMVDNLPTERKSNCVVLQMVGGLGEPKSETHATGLVSRTAMALGAGMWLMPAPGVMDSVDSAKLLVSDRAISQSLERAGSADIAFVGIGNPTRDSLLMRDGYIISWPEMESLIDQGAVGDIGLRYYDIHGSLVHSPMNERVIGITLDKLREIKRVVGVAGGIEKTKAIIGAIHGKLINTLITDLHTAQLLLQ
ncbi:MAG: hypothetical protein C0391_07075 [Anaerolinea sp.]|nr:hypothetical protein [Anaerolinea sp.]